MIKIFNTLTKQKEDLKLIDENHLKIYVCGPTVYSRPHIGNARSMVIYDLFYRFFKEKFKKVTYARNITDVDDKINVEARKRGISIFELTKEITENLHQDLAYLNVLKPDFEPKATDHINEMIQIIQKLIDGGFAYEKGGHVLFSVKKFKDYNKLSRQNLSEIIAGARIEVESYKNDALDFVLWKPAPENDDESSIFQSPWSLGRPGWHIECSAMSHKYLGENFDIHGGGIDLQFPHHENEIAQSKCAFQGSNFATYWVHNGFLTVEGEKMSKSLNNFITVFDLQNQGEIGIVIRYLLLSTHYRKPLDFSKKALLDAKKSIEKFYAGFDENDVEASKKAIIKNENNEILTEIFEFLSDDLNISKVFALLHEKSGKIKENQDLKNKFIKSLDFLGLLDENYFKDSAKKHENSTKIDENFIKNEILRRKQAKIDKNYQLADEIRDNLLKQGVVLKDGKNGEVEFEIK